MLGCCGGVSRYVQHEAEPLMHDGASGRVVCICTPSVMTKRKSAKTRNRKSSSGTRQFDLVDGERNSRSKGSLASFLPHSFFLKITVAPGRLSSARGVKMSSVITTFS
jgi:hypothetical protein